MTLLIARISHSSSSSSEDQSKPSLLSPVPEPDAYDKTKERAETQEDNDKKEEKSSDS